MKVFLGSSSESKNDMREVATWLEYEGHEPILWDDLSLFLPGENTFAKIIEISKQVDAAVFIFSEDDKIWYRQDTLAQPRDNVLIEYGLFAGVLGKKRAIVCHKGDPKKPTDLYGIVHVDLNMKHRARLSISNWIKSLETKEQDMNDILPQLWRTYCLFGYETDGGRESIFWKDPMSFSSNVSQSENELHKRFDAWMRTKRKFSFDEIVDGIWIKAGDHGYHRRVNFWGDGSLIERPLFSFNKDEHWGGAWKLINGVLRMNVGKCELDIFASMDGMHSGAEDFDEQRNAYFRVIHVK